MTQDQIEQSIRSVERVCKGDWRLDPQQRIELTAQWQIVASTLNWSAATIFLRMLEKTTSAGESQIPADDWEAWTVRVSNLITGHKNNCGYDVNMLILSQPLDGLEHTAPCPGCGNAISWCPAIYEVS